MLRTDASTRLRATCSTVADALHDACEPERLAQIAVREVRAWTGADLVVLHRAGRELTPAGASDLGEGDDPLLEAHPIDLASPLGLAVVERRAMWVEARGELDRRFPRVARSSAATLGVAPLIADGLVLGTLTLGWRAAVGLDGERQGLVLGLAEVVAEAVSRVALVDREALRLFQLARAERLAAAEDRRRAEEAIRIKDEFLATVSHELRTPLTAILGWAEILRAEAGLERAKLAKGLEVIRQNARAQAKLVDDVLDMSQMLTGRLRIDPSPTDLVDVARDALAVVRPAADARGVRLVEGALERPVRIACDRRRIHQAAWNLLSNAVKFTPEGGAVTVHVGRRGAEATLVVEDTGPGLAPEFLPHVFDRFRQADGSSTRRHGGLGLGLAIVRHVAELHGGRVVAESEGLGRGARFTLALPVRAVLPGSTAAERADALPAVVATPVAADLVGLRVLILDDDLDARELIRETLALRGAEVVTCAAAAEALARLARFDPHVLLSDIGMPGEDGYALIRRVRALAPGDGGAVPAVALTAYARPEDRARALAAGFDVHLAKPVDPDALATAVAALGRCPSQLGA